MATSGTYTFAYNRDQIIKAAARRCSAIKAGETPDADTVQDFSDALNAMVKHWQAKGIHIWTVAEAVLFLQADQVQYGLGSSSTDHATESFVETTLSAAAASGASTYSITSASGISASMYIGVELDSGAMAWSTVSVIAGTTVTPAAALSGAAASGNRVLAYTTKLVRPLRIVSARRFNFGNDLDTPLQVMSRLEYHEMPNKTQEATVLGVFYDPKGGANALGQLFTWPESDTVDDCIKFTYYRPIQDFSAAANDPDLPQEWIQTLISNLAARMAPEYDVPLERYQVLQAQATQDMDDVSGWDREPESVFFGVDMR